MKTTLHLTNYYMALIPLARATELVPNYSTSDSAMATDLLNAASDLIEKWCNRTFALTTYDQLVDGQGHYNLLLDNYPVTYVKRIAYSPVNVLQIFVQDTTVQRASWRIDGDGSTPPAVNNMYLEYMKNGVLTQNTLSLASYATVNALATAIGAISPWTAMALGSPIFGSWAVSDLYPQQGGYEAHWLGVSFVWLHQFGLSDFRLNANIGEVVSSRGFARGYQNYRVIYQAGFAVIPNPIQQACAELFTSMYYSTKKSLDANLSNETIGAYNYTQLAEKSFNNLSIASRYGLYQFKSTRIPKFKVV